MAEEMMLEAWESDESEDSESDEALVEAEDSADDIGERLFRRRPQRRRSHFRPIRRPVAGMRVQGADGRARRMPFPAKLATAEETNRGLATQEVGRRALEERMDRLETRFRVQQKKDSSASGLVSLAIGGGLTAYSLVKASQVPGDGSLFGKWTSQETARMATLASVSQIATTGAKLLVNGRYHRSAVGIAADAFATLQVAGYAIATLYQPVPPPTFRVVTSDSELDKAASAAGAKAGDLIYQSTDEITYILRLDAATNKLVPIPQ